MELAHIKISDPDFAAYLRAAGARVVPLRCPTADVALEQLDGQQIIDAVSQVLADPLEFPPLAQATVPGDHVAIALGDGIPQVDLVASGAVEACRRAGVDVDRLAIVVASEQAAERLTSPESAFDAAGVTIVQHDPNDENELCYVGTTVAGEPLKINRVLFDADVVLPIGCWQSSHGTTNGSVFGALYPWFADAAAITRQHGAAAERESAPQREAANAGWLMGISMVVCVVPGPAGSVSAIVAGSPQADEVRSTEIGNSQWTQLAGEPASLVVGIIGQPEDTSRWSEVAAAVHAANQIRMEDGALVLCCGQLAPPGKSLRRLTEADDYDVVRHDLQNDHYADTQAAWQLSTALDRGPVYLLGGLAPTEAEQIGLAPVADVVELARLATRHPSCIVLNDAQHIMARIAEVPDE